MINSLFLAAIQSTTPPTPNWTPSVGLVMLVCNLFAILVLSRTIRRRGVGPALPFAAPGLPDGFGIPELLATTSFGHILGAGAILGLTNAGIL